MTVRSSSRMTLTFSEPRAATMSLIQVRFWPTAFNVRLTLFSLGLRQRMAVAVNSLH
jgi:hypothetical protein